MSGLTEREVETLIDDAQEEIRLICEHYTEAGLQPAVMRHVLAECIGGLSLADAIAKGLVRREVVH